MKEFIRFFKDEEGATAVVCHNGGVNRDRYRCNGSYCGQESK